MSAALQVFRPIDPLIAARPRWSRHQADLFVVPDRLRLAARYAGKIANRIGLPVPIEVSLSGRSIPLDIGAAQMLVKAAEDALDDITFYFRRRAAAPISLLLWLLWSIAMPACDTDWPLKRIGSTYRDLSARPMTGA
jgi:hypothetical protein